MAEECYCWLNHIGSIIKEIPTHTLNHANMFRADSRLLFSFFCFWVRSSKKFNVKKCGLSLRWSNGVYTNSTSDILFVCISVVPGDENFGEFSHDATNKLNEFSWSKFNSLSNWTFNQIHHTFFYFSWAKTWIVSVLIQLICIRSSFKNRNSLLANIIQNPFFLFRIECNSDYVQHKSYLKRL